MRIIQTVNYGLDEERFYTAMEEAKRNFAYGIRFNFCKYQSNEWKQALPILGRCIERYKNDFEFSIDLPYPRNKVRILQNSLKNGKVCEGKKYKIITETSFEKGETGDIVVSCDKFDLTEKLNVLCYGDGEGAFRTEMITRSTIEAKACNDFLIWNGKSISCGFIRAKESIYEVVDFFSALDVPDKMNYFLSFVRDSEEVARLKERIDTNKFNVVSKIETVENYDMLEKIVAASDGVMLARGDMAIYMSQFNPICISRQIKKSNQKKRFFAATDILRGLENAVIPNRAEIMDLYALMDVGCTDIVLTNFMKNSERVYKYIRDAEYIQKTKE